MAECVETMSRNGPVDLEIADAEIVPEEPLQLRKGLSLYSPHAVDLKAKSEFLIVGGDFHQMLQLLLQPGQIVTVEPGSMTMMSGDLVPEIENGGFGAMVTRCLCPGESFYRLVFENKTCEDQFISLSPPHPGRVIPINLERSSGITIIPGAFLCALGTDWEYKAKFVDSGSTACCGGHGFFCSQLFGTGTVFIHAMGTVQTLHLSYGESIVLDKDALVAFDSGVQHAVQPTDGCLVCCCKGMDLVNVRLTGPGQIIIQSLSIEKLKWAVGGARGGTTQEGQVNDLKK